MGKSRAFIFIIILISVISVGFLFIDDPEDFEIFSADQIVTISGSARNWQEFSIEILGSYIYKIEPSSGVLDQPVSIEFDITNAEYSFDIAVYKYNDEILMWEDVSAVIGQNSDSITIQQSEFGIYMVKEFVDISAPDFISTFDDVLNMAPENAVGYEIATGFIASDGSVIRLDDKSQVGGCNGIIESGNREELSQLERSARVYVNDVEQEVDFLIVAQWFVNEIRGCVDEQYFGPLDL